MAFNIIPPDLAH